MRQAVTSRRGWTWKGITVLGVFGALTLAAAANQGGGSRFSPATRVDRVPRPADFRIKPPDMPSTGSSKNMSLETINKLQRYPCPETKAACKKFWGIIGHFMVQPTIPARDRELLILRTAYLSRFDYEWDRHYLVHGPKIGLKPDEMMRVTQGPDAKGWSEFEATLLRAADDLHSVRFITDETWQKLGTRYDDYKRVEVALIVGNYTMLGMYFNTIGSPGVPGATGVPD